MALGTSDLHLKPRFLFAQVFRFLINVLQVYQHLSAGGGIGILQFIDIIAL